MGNKWRRSAQNHIMNTKKNNEIAISTLACTPIVGRTFAYQNFLSGFIRMYVWVIMVSILMSNITQKHNFIRYNILLH